MLFVHNSLCGSYVYILLVLKMEDTKSITISLKLKVLYYANDSIVTHVQWSQTFSSYLSRVYDIILEVTDQNKGWTGFSNGTMN